MAGSYWNNDTGQRWKIVGKVTAKKAVLVGEGTDSTRIDTTPAEMRRLFTPVEEGDERVCRARVGLGEWKYMSKCLLRNMEYYLPWLRKRS